MVNILFQREEKKIIVQRTAKESSIAMVLFLYRFVGQSRGGSHKPQFGENL